MRYTFFLIIIVATILSIGCKKETIDDIYAEKTGKGANEVLPVVSNSFWRLTSIKLFFSNGTTADSVIDDCEKDDLATYNINGDMTIIHGSVACTINPADGKFGDWELLDNGTRIKETYTRDMRGIPTGTVRNFHIDYVAFKMMKISRAVNDAVLGTYTEATTLTR